MGGKYEGTVFERVLWYRSAIVSKEVGGQYGTVWARLVLFTSLVLLLRFSTLLTQHYRRKPAE
jgi:hypothetical protein